MLDARTRAVALAALTLLAVGLPAAGAPAFADTAAAGTTDSITVTVIEVTDGDTFDVRYPNGSTDTVRLLGVDTPETYGANSPSEFEGVPDTQAGADCLGDYGEQATSYAESAVEGEQVELRFDSEADRRGIYGRLLAYVYDDGVNVNHQLVEQGDARVYDSTFSKSSSFYAAEDDAQTADRGLWTCRDAGSLTGFTVSYVHEDAYGDDATSLNDEYVTFENTGSETVYLAGSHVQDEAGATYQFDAGVALDPGETVTLHTGSGSDTAAHVYWGRSTPVWNNDGDTVYVYENDWDYETSEAY